LAYEKIRSHYANHIGQEIHIFFGPRAKKRTESNEKELFSVMESASAGTSIFENRILVALPILQRFFTKKYR
jgi:hypothetical protein